MFDYAVLRLLWWALLGVLLMGIAVMDGFDLGAAMLLPFIGRTDMERRIVINTVGPVWEGNQVWLILGGGAIFAAWPPLYAVAFSGFYLAMLLLLCALILRPVGFKFRSKLAGTRWRKTWDAALVLGGLVPALVFGVAFGNVLQGVPFRFDDSLRLTYEGSLWGLFNPFALLTGLISVTMLAMHGGLYVACKTEGVLRLRAQRAASAAGLATIVLFLLGGVWAATLRGYVLSGIPVVDGPSNPLLKQVFQIDGQLVVNYHLFPPAMLAPIVGVLGAVLAMSLARSDRLRPLSLVLSGLSVAGIIATAGVSLFPFLLPSSIDPRSSLTVWDASSSRTTLLIMTGATVVFLPVVIAYTAWVYRVLRGPVTADRIAASSQSYY